MESNDGCVQSHDTKYFTTAGFMKSKKLGYLKDYFKLVEYYTVGN